MLKFHIWGLQNPTERRAWEICIIGFPKLVLDFIVPFEAVYRVYVKPAHCSESHVQGSSKLRANRLPVQFRVFLVLPLNIKETLLLRPTSHPSEARPPLAASSAQPRPLKCATIPLQTFILSLS